MLSKVRRISWIQCIFKRIKENRWERIIKKITDNVFQRIELHAANARREFGTVFESMDFSVYLKYGTGKKKL